jgi:hypothetical protein
MSSAKIISCLIKYFAIFIIDVLLSFIILLVFLYNSVKIFLTNSLFHLLSFNTLTYPSFSKRQFDINISINLSILCKSSEAPVETHPKNISSVALPPNNTHIFA